MGKVIHIDGSGGGGGGTVTGWQGQVPLYANLPVTLGTPAIGEVYLVESPTTIGIGIFQYTTKQSGLYIRDFDTGALSDWRKLNVKVKFTDSEFAVVNAIDTSKQAKFDLSLVAAATTRTLQVQNKNGVIALLSDITPVTPTPPLSVVLGIGNQTNGNDIIVNESDTLKLEYANFLNNISTNPLTSNRDIRFPDNSGTVALKKNIALSQGYNIQSILTVPTLTATVNDWNPIGFDLETDLIRVDINANNRAITGIVAPPLGVNRILGIKNLNTVGNDLRFENNNAGSSPQNRFLCRDNTRKSIKPNEMALWFYDHIIQRWTPFNRIG